MDDPQGNKLRSASCGNQPMTAVGPSRGVGAEPFAGAVAARQTSLRPTSSPPTPTSSTSTSSLSSTTPAVLSFPAAADYAASDHLLRYPSRVGSSGFSSASSDTTDTSLTSLSLSSTSRGQSPFGFSGCGPPVAPQSAASTLVAGAGSVAATGTSLPSSPSFYEQGTASSSSSSSWTPGYPGGGRNSLSSSLAGSFFLPGPAITPEIAPIPSASPDGGADAPEYLPPSNFGMVAPGVYRSSFPKPENFAFLRSLGLKSVLCVPPPPSSWPKGFLSEVAQYAGPRQLPGGEQGVSRARRDPLLSVQHTRQQGPSSLAICPLNRADGVFFRWTGAVRPQCAPSHECPQCCRG